MDFDDVARGYEHARYMGRVVTGGVLQAYDKVKYIDVETLRYKQRMIQIPSKMPKKEELEEAYRINDLQWQIEMMSFQCRMLTMKVVMKQEVRIFEQESLN